MTFMAKPDEKNSTSVANHGKLTLEKLPIHDARDLTQGGALAQIALNGQVYTLRITRAGKLILTK